MSSSLRAILFNPAVGRVIALLLGFVVIAALVRYGRKVLLRRFEASSARYRVRKLLAFAGYVAAIVLILIIYSNQLAGLAVAFGVAGAGVAFALQEVIASVAGWVALTLSHWYSPGDRIQLGGITGDVIDIGILRTTLMECGQWVHADLYNGRIVRVTNSFVFKEPVVNYSGDFPFLWDEITVPVRYGGDRTRARAILEQVVNDVNGDYALHSREAWARMVQQYRIDNTPVDSMVTLIANDNWLEFTVRYVVDYRHRRDTKDLLFSKILDAFDATNGAVTFASSTFELVGAPPIVVRQDPAGAQAGGGAGTTVPESGSR